MNAKLTATQTTVIKTAAMEATGWQAHTVRGTFAGALKKKRCLNIVSAKAATGERVYRIG